VVQVLKPLRLPTLAEVEYNVTAPVWSVIILLCCGLVFTLYCVIYILRLSFEELEDGRYDTTKSEELLQLPSDEHR